MKKHRHSRTDEIERNFMRNKGAIGIIGGSFHFKQDSSKQGWLC